MVIAAFVGAVIVLGFLILLGAEMIIESLEEPFDSDSD
jgi:hypothetical protein